MINKILLITKREYLSRVKKRSFIIMTFLGPLLIVGFYAIIIFLSLNNNIGSKVKNVAVYDQSHLLFNTLRNNDIARFELLGYEPSATAPILKSKKFDHVLIIPPLDSAYNLGDIMLEGLNQPGMSIVNTIESQLENALEDLKFRQHNYDPDEIKSIRSDVSIKTLKLTDKGTEKSSSGVFTIAGLIAAICIYMFIFIYGVQVMRGVIEEKTNRIVEVMISSVKPFELMMGKIMGIAAVGLTQFIIWIVLTTTSFGVLTNYLAKSSGKTVEQIQQIAAENKNPVFNNPDSDKTVQLLGKVNEGIGSLNFPLITVLFLFYFISGYLFYGALFAAVGSAVDSDTDTQQFMLPITLPLIFGLVLSTSSVANDPEGTLAHWLSIIPFTSPIAMMVRVPFIGHFTWEIAISMMVMVVSFIFMVWLAGRIYRTGILMYGKKVTYKELGKWLFYKS